MAPIAGVVVAALVCVGWIAWRKRQAASELPVTRPRTVQPVTRRAVGGGDGARPEVGGERLNWLIGVAGDVAGKEFYVGPRTVTIGRAPGNAVQTTDAKASRKHCQISPHGPGLKLVDMSSSNGTRVNGRPVKEALLSYGDSVRIGEAELVFMRTAAEGADAVMERKLINRMALEATSLGQQVSLDAIISQTVAQCGGDLEQAARRLGCEVEFLQRLAEREAQPRA